jgi:teichuronic acid biosynthesis glycosyltransferase TuaH
VAANPLVAASFRSSGHSPFLIPFGCDASHFETARSLGAPPEVRLAPPYAVFMGHLGDRIDVPILERLADDGVRILLLGPIHPRTDPSRFASLFARPEVQWVGGQEFDQLPKYLAGSAVGLVPYTDSRFNLGSFPLKTFEYLAAGLPVVATSLPAMDWIDSADIHLADTLELFSSKVRLLLQAGRDAAGDERRSRLARMHSWDQRADEVLRVLEIPRVFERSGA